MRALWLWLKAEWRLMWADNWQPELHEAFTVATREDERCKRLLYRQAKVASLLHGTGRSLASGKRYIPVLTKPVDPPPRRSDKVIPMRKKR